MSSCIHCGTTPTLLESSPLNPKSWPHSAANTAENFQKAACFSPTPENTHLLLLLDTVTPMSSGWLTDCRICLHSTESYRIQNTWRYHREMWSWKLEIPSDLSQNWPLYPMPTCTHTKEWLLSSNDPEGGQIDQNSQNRAKHPFLLFPRRQHEWCICGTMSTGLRAACKAVATATWEPPPSDCQEVQYAMPKKKATQIACFLKRS